LGTNNNYGFYANDNCTSVATYPEFGLRYDGMPHALSATTSLPTRRRRLRFLARQSGHGCRHTESRLAELLLKASNSTQRHQATDVGGSPWRRPERLQTWQPRIGFAYNINRQREDRPARRLRRLLRNASPANDVYNAALNPPSPISHPRPTSLLETPTPAFDRSNHDTVFPVGADQHQLPLPESGHGNSIVWIQPELAPSVVAVVQYVGSDGWSQTTTAAINTLPLTDPTNSANPYDDREGVANGSLECEPVTASNPGFSGIEQEENETNFNYNSLQAAFALRINTA